MKKTYITPTVDVSGDIIAVTRGVAGIGDEPGTFTKPMVEGSVGYDL